MAQLNLDVTILIHFIFSLPGKNCSKFLHELPFSSGNVSNIYVYLLNFIYVILCFHESPIPLFEKNLIKKNFFFNFSCPGSSLWCMWVFSTCSTCDSLVAAEGLYSVQAQQLQGIGVVALRHVGSYISDQRLNRGSLHWKVASLLLDHQHSPSLDWFGFLQKYQCL